MLLCLCYGVSEKVVLKEISEGCKSVKSIQAKFKVGTNCGSCVCYLRDLIDQEKRKAQTTLEVEEGKS